MRCALGSRDCFNAGSVLKHHPELDSHNITASSRDHPEDNSEGKPSQWAESPALLTAVALLRRKNGQI